jgi:hypothetical protein
MILPLLVSVYIGSQRHSQNATFATFDINFQKMNILRCIFVANLRRCKGLDGQALLLHMAVRFMQVGDRFDRCTALRPCDRKK